MKKEKRKENDQCISKEISYNRSVFNLKDQHVTLQEMDRSKENSWSRGKRENVFSYNLSVDAQVKIWK